MTSRLLGILVMVLALYGAVLASDFPTARSLENHQNLARRTGYWGVLTIGTGLGNARFSNRRSNAD